jgi:alpha,alpha-trehalase
MEWVADLVANFDYLIQTLGHVPNGNRTYYESRSQPPFFALMVDGLAQASEDPYAVYARHLDALKKEYLFWSAPERTRDGLTRYYDEENGPRVEMFGTDLEWLSHAEQRPEFFRHLRAACESGWDFSSRWFEQGKGLESIETLDLCPVDLNCLLYFLEELLGRITGEKEYVEAAQRRKLAIQQKMFDPEKGFFDWQWTEGRLRTEHPSAAMMYPLFMGVASEAQAEVVVAQMKQHLLQKGGITTTPVFSGQQWDAPNGWAPLQWVAFEGLRKYGFEQEARDLAERWLHTCEVVYEAQGKFVEKYNVYEPKNLSAGGEYDLQDGFGWSNGVYLAMKAALK